MTNSVQKYFDNVAGGYKKKSHFFPFNYLRAKELEAFDEALSHIHCEKRDILEIGAGAGFYTDTLLRKSANTLTVCDISSKMLTHLPEDQIRKIHGDFCLLNLSSQYDLIFAMSVFEFIYNRDLFFKKVSVSLKANGFLILSNIRKNFFGQIYFLYHRQHNLRIQNNPLDFNEIENTFNLKMVFQKNTHFFSQILIFKCLN